MSMRLPLRFCALWACAALAVLTVGCADQPFSFLAPNAPATPTPLPLPTRVVQARSSVVADGVLELTASAIPLSFELNSRVTGVFASAGQAVKKGEVLATIDDTPLRDAVADAKAQLALLEAQIAQGSAPARQEDIDSARAALSAAYAQYNILRKGPAPADVEQALRAWNAAVESLRSAKMSRDAACGGGIEAAGCQSSEAAHGNAYENERAAYDRYQALLQPASRNQLAQAYATVASAQARLDALYAGQSPEQLKSSMARLEQARAGVARAEKNLAKAELVSPCDCTVQDVNVSAGSTPGGPAFTLLDLSGLRFKTTNLSELDLASVEAGAPATVRLKAFDRPFTGRVDAILPLPETGAGAVAGASAQAGGTAVFTVLIALDPAAETLLPGMTGQAEIAIR